jgi:predicted Zn-dependent peptidase
MSCLFCLTLLTFTPAAQAGDERRAAAVVAPAEVGPAALHDRRPPVRGRLKNGLRYAILPRRGTEPGVALFLRVEGGFLAERRPGERGLAHLIEHLVFHSPTRTAPNAYRRFRQVGFPLSLPEPAGGTTSWRESDYFLVSRTTKLADLDTLLGLFREVAGELTFRADAVDGQRAEVMREMSDKKLGNDIYASYIAAVAPGSPTDVIDAQNSDDVPTADVETIRALYHRLYRPEHMTVVLVGDVDAARVKTLIEQRFGGWRGVGPVPDRVPVPTFRSDRIAPVSHSDFRYGRHSAMTTVAVPLPPPPSSRKGQAEAMLMDMLAMRAVNERLALAHVGHPSGKYGFFIENGEQGHRLLMFWDEFAPGEWRRAVAGLKRTTCDLSTVGFSEEEWTAAKRNLLQDLAGRTKAMAGTRNFELARELANAITSGRDLIPPDELLGHARTWLPMLGAREGSEWWRRQWSAGVEHIRVESSELARVENPEAAIRATVDRAVQAAGCRVRPS